MNNATYTVGDVFIRDDCSGRCRCDAKNVTNTEIVCQPLCNTSVTCPTGFKQNASLDFIPGSNCTCRSTSCVPGLLSLSLTNIGQKFVLTKVCFIDVITRKHFVSILLS